MSDIRKDIRTKFVPSMRTFKKLSFSLSSFDEKSYRDWGIWDLHQAINLGRNQNTDDYWRERLDCIDQAYSEQKRLTEKEFARLEHAIKKMAPGTGKMLCPLMIEDTTQCYVTYPNEPANCKHVVQKLELCLDTIMQETAKKRRRDNLRKKKPKCRI